MANLDDLLNMGLGGSTSMYQDSFTPLSMNVPVKKNEKKKAPAFVDKQPLLDQAKLSSILAQLKPQPIAVPMAAPVATPVTKVVPTAAQNAPALQSQANAIAKSQAPAKPTESPAVYESAASGDEVAQPITPIAGKDSGMTYDNKNQLTTTDSTEKSAEEKFMEKFQTQMEDLNRLAETRKLRMTPEQFAEERTAMINSGAFDNQINALNNQEEMLSMASRAPSASPLAAALATFSEGTGRPVSSIAKQYMSPQSALDKILAYQEKIADNKAALERTITEANKGREYGVDVNTTSNIMKQLDENTKSQEFKDMMKKINERITAKSTKSEDPTIADNRNSNALARDKRIFEKGLTDELGAILKPWEESHSNMKAIAEGLKRGDIQGIKSVLPLIARNIGTESGALAKYDLENFLKRTLSMDIDEFVGYLESNPKRKLSPQVTQGLKEIAYATMKKLSTKRRELLKTRKDTINSTDTPRELGVDVNKIFSSMEKRQKEMEDSYNQYSPDAIKEVNGKKYKRANGRWELIKEEK